MTAPELVQALFGRIMADDFEGAAKLLAPGFRHDSVISGGIDAEQWLAADQVLRAAMPDLDFDIRDLVGDEYTATGTFNITGTHTGRLLLAARGLDIAPTGRKVQLPPEPFQARAEDGLLEWLHVDHPPDSGLPELLRQLGVE